MKYKKLLVITFFLCMHGLMHAVSLVYNLRVRRVFDVPFIINKPDSYYLATVLPDVLFRRSNPIFETADTEVSEKRRTGGCLLNFRSIPSDNWFFEGTTAIGTDQVEYTGHENFSATRYGFDDIVLVGGYRYFIKKHLQIVGYGLVGLPTCRRVTLCDRFDPLLGTRFYNLGAGIEGSYSIVKDNKKSCAFIAQGRLIHSLARNWFPIVPQNGILYPGNTWDFQVSVRMRDHKTVLEFGYDLTAYSKRTIRLDAQSIRESDGFIRHSGYINIYRSLDQVLFNKGAIIGIGCNINAAKRYRIRTFDGFLFFTQLF